ncbi:MAG: outer membrane protein assembly factor BamD [Bacteroidales bacterium]|nr:outer membrane protein assembly factor BamD [Bacteroidales bacterium]MBQ7985019.1 outer membrane protein assembly factor BamD [Bacteroidales bacterium]
MVRYKFKAVSLLLLTFSVCMLCSCASSHKKLLKSDDNEAKYEAAVKAYNQGDYYKANQLFDNLLLYFRGRDKAEDVSLYYAKSLMGGKDYFSAGYQFENFVRWFPYSPKAEEALYYCAYCKFKESPEYYLDQTLTVESIKAFEDYIDKYPESPRVQQANECLDELRMKLIKKDYTNAYNYYKVGQYQAAHVALKEFISRYADQTQYRQDAMYYIVLADYHYAYGSVPEKQKERWTTMILDYEKYQALFENFTDKAKTDDLKKKYEYAKAQVGMN